MRTRVISALIIVPLAALFIYLGGWYFFGGVAIMALLGIWEFWRMMTVKQHGPHLALGIAVGALALLSMKLPGVPIFIPGLSLLLIVGLVWELFDADTPAPVVDWALSIVGPVYIGLALGHLIGLRDLPNGLAWVWMAMLATWASDSFAYLVGRTFGKHKFWPRISPKKTWEGIFGGVLGGMIGAMIVSLLSGLPWYHALIIGALVSVVGPLGDLSISMMKRYAGVKDSSHLIPGHGGMLDRMDSVLFVSVAVFYYVLWVVV